MFSFEMKNPAMVIDFNDNQFIDNYNQKIDFSENGFYILHTNSDKLNVWDLRKTPKVIYSTEILNLNNAFFDFSGGLITFCTKNNEYGILNIKESKLFTKEFENKNDIVTGFKSKSKENNLLCFESGEIINMKLNEKFFE